MPLASQPLLPLLRGQNKTISILFLSYNISYAGRLNPSSIIRFRRFYSRAIIIQSPCWRTDRNVSSTFPPSSSPSRTFIRTHMGHNHDHHHHEHDTTLLTSKDTSNPGVRITRIGLYSLSADFNANLCRLVNLALVVVKAAAGIVFHSSSLLADAGHSAADILSDILTLSTITFSAKEPTLRYPLGFGKVETLGAIGVSSLLRAHSPVIRADLVLGGVGIGLSSLDQLLQTLPPNALPPLLEQLIHAGHSHGHSHGPITGTDPLALWVAGGSIGIKEWLFRATKKIAIETNSTVLLANVSRP